MSISTSHSLAGRCRRFCRLESHNKLARFSCKILLLCDLLEIPASAENPATSRFWILPPVIQIAKRKSFRLFCTDYCAFGMPFRKRTRFLSTRVDLESMCFKCSGKSKCSFSGKPHVMLVGTDEDGVFLAHLAGPYPKKMVAIMAKCFEYSIDAQRTHTFSKWW